MEKEISVIITSELDSKSVGYIISNRLKLSRTIVAKLKNYEKGIILNGERVRTNTLVKVGDELILNIPEQKSLKVKQSNIFLDILYEDDDVIVVNKPPNMPSHPSKNCTEGTLANALMYYFGGKDFVFRVITRLDKDTSGVVLVAKNHYSAQRLNEEMRKGEIKKEYIALVNGRVNNEKGEINLPIKKERGVLHVVSPEGKDAKTLYFVEKIFKNTSLVRLVPLTGRTHQLRVHMKSMGNPIYGDWLYGAAQRGERCRLHCRKLEFMHPVTREKISVEAPVPEDITKLCCKKQ